jgi:zinc transporter 1
VDSSKAGHGHDLGMMGVLVHVIGDAINNIGVIIASAVIWKAKYEGRFYADPGVSMGIAIMILLSSIPLGLSRFLDPLYSLPFNWTNIQIIVKNSGSILLESVPLGVSLEDVRHDLEKVDGVLSIHELHAWRLSQTKALASAHVLTTSDSLADFMVQAKHINECLHAYGIHSSTLQPELVTGTSPMVAAQLARKRLVRGLGGKERGVEGNVNGNAGCRINCGSSCEELTCCG